MNKHDRAQTEASFAAIGYDPERDISDMVDSDCGPVVTFRRHPYRMICVTTADGEGKAGVMWLDPPPNRMSGRVETVNSNGLTLMRATGWPLFVPPMGWVDPHKGEPEPEPVTEERVTEVDPSSQRKRRG